MVLPAPVARRRALWAALCLLATFAGLIGAVAALAWALEDDNTPDLQTITEATHLTYPDSTDVVEADIAALHAPAPGASAEVTVDIPADDFGTFIADNGMDPPLVSGTTPAGTASGLLASDCTDEVCYSGTVILDEETVTVRLRITLI
ncbi:hypothetical protein [Glycomyces buryatensis]|uniref:Uncharacterized protein n=1 Tax=Glycomyces buryatensis TaxID=2570927 RepID=A0A4S8PQK1_9ACTN|nr:hypothetical protein [Glycomyces buryatensis]THV33423.1 hypothetical protein FAB82_25075 [Glycomyces buryatensis]